MDEKEIFMANSELELSHSFDKWSGFNVTDCSAQLKFGTDAVRFRLHVACLLPPPPRHCHKETRPSAMARLGDSPQQCTHPALRPICQREFLPPAESNFV